MQTVLAPTRRVLLLRQGLVYPRPATASAPVDEALMRAVDLELAGLGYALSTRLRQALSRSGTTAVTEAKAWLWQTLAEHTGASRNHTPLFRKFPDGVPEDTFELWIRKFIGFYCQTADQPCLWCRRVGTTHVLSPCMHVVCDHCFDGANYSACPVCERHVDRSSPFFQPDGGRKASPDEAVRFKLLDLGDEPESAAAAVVRSLCDRKQPLSPADKDDLTALILDHGARVLDWLPEVIPVKETTATVLGLLYLNGAQEAALEAAARRFKTATDVLRFIAAISGEDPALQGQRLREQVPGTREVKTRVVRRFKVAKLPRSVRRRLLALLESFAPEALTEDMLRHQSYWVWVGQFLHPHEYADRFPNVAQAFAVVRKYAPNGARAPRFRSYASRLDAALLRRDSDTLIAMLSQRPGEWARRFDHVLRAIAADPAAADKLVAAFTDRLSACATPVLLTLWSLLPTRLAPAPVRIYWPKSLQARGVSAPDRRPALGRAAVETTVAAIEAELLRRFAEKPPVDAMIVDEALKDVIVPFNERTAARSAIALPRGSRVHVPAGKMMRLFLHWCQPAGSRHATDLDLSIGFFDTRWAYKGVCSYYQLRFPEGQAPIAQSSGDLRDAPFPDGASEFVDLDRARAREAGLRYAVMVVNAYAGLPFDALERGFAGLMLRDDMTGLHFDPRTVALKFALAGEHGMYLPFVLDLETDTLHWLDLYSKGEFEFNNVENSKKAIARFGPEMIAYFASGIRPSMYDLALLHAASRAQRVVLRTQDGPRLFERGADAPGAFLKRLRTETVPFADTPLDGQTILAALHTGDLDLPADASRYVLFPERLTGNMAASDFLS